MLLLLLLHYKLGGIPLAEEKEKSLTDETLPKKPEEASADWDWDAAVPQTDTSNITLDDLQETEEKVIEPAEEAEEKAAEEDEAAADPNDDGLCIVCGKQRGSSPSDLYCNECRAKFLRTNYGVGHIILAFVMVIVAALGYFVATSTVTVSSKLYKAEKYISENKFDDALNLCSEAVEATDKLNSGVNAVIKGINSNITNQDWFTEGDKATHLILETYIHTMTINYSDRSTFIEAVEKYFTDDELNQPRNAEIKKLYDVVNELDTMATSIEEEMNSFISQKEDGTYDVKYDDGIKYLDSLTAESDVQKGLVDYYKFMLAYYASKDGKTALGFIDGAYTKSGDYGYLYLQNYMAMAWQYEDYDKVLELAKTATELNVNDASAYYYSVKVYIERTILKRLIKFARICARQIPKELIITARRRKFFAVRTSLTKQSKSAARVSLQALIPKSTVSRPLHISSRVTRRTHSKPSSSPMSLLRRIHSSPFRRQTPLLLSVSSATTQPPMRRSRQCLSRAAWS